MGSQQLNEKMLVQAMRERILDEIKRRNSDSHSIVNNVYGSSTAGKPGIMGALGGESSDSASDPRGDHDYFVDILRENLDPEDPKKGWKKSVHRYVQPKKKKTDR